MSERTVMSASQVTDEVLYKGLIDAGVTRTIRMQGGGESKGYPHRYIK